MSTALNNLKNTIKTHVHELNSACREIYAHPAGKQLFVETAAIAATGIITLLSNRFYRPISAARAIAGLCCYAIYGNCASSVYLADSMAKVESQRDQLREKYNDLLARHYADLPADQREGAHFEEQRIDEEAELETNFEEEMRNDLHQEFANYYNGHVAQ